MKYEYDECLWHWEMLPGYFLGWLFLKKGHQLELQWPKLTESGTFVQKRIIRTYLNLNLRRHERGARTLPLC